MKFRLSGKIRYALSFPQSWRVPWLHRALQCNKLDDTRQLSWSAASQILLWEVSRVGGQKKSLRWLAHMKHGLSLTFGGGDPPCRVASISPVRHIARGVCAKTHYSSPPNSLEFVLTLILCFIVTLVFLKLPTLERNALQRSTETFNSYR